MKNAPIEIEIILNAPIAKVWDAISNKEKMKLWYFDFNDFKIEKGFEFNFIGCKDENTEYLHLCKIMEVIDEKKISYSWRYDGYEGNSLVSYEIFDETKTPAESRTRLVLTHSGLETFPAANADFSKENFVAGWNQIIGTSLKNFVEE